MTYKLPPLFTGDPISPFLSILSAEILAKVIRVFDEVGGIEGKLSLYAEGTTLFLKDVNTFKRLWAIFPLVSVVSGLPINMEKTKVIKIGASRATGLT